MASRIQKLPQEIAEKIAAGEVVERPVSVVKELVENSLDAHATRIEVFIEEGGKKRICVQDDGMGMNVEEMHLALQRHATSKVKSLDDLFAISTLGFRGEALPSLSAVSRFNLKSKSKDESQSSAYEIALEGGKVLRENETGHPQGTTIEAVDLFFNTPARLKFLKSNETEWGHIEDYLIAMSLAYPEVQWVATHQKKEKIKFLKRGIKNRLLDIFGSEVVQGLYPIHEEKEDFSIEGFIGHPNLSKSQSSQMTLFLNQRWIKDRLINHAVMQGYRNYLMKDQYPLVILSLKIKPHLVDVNVHPTKREVRFVQSNVMHQFVSQSISKALGQEPWRKKEDGDLNADFSRPSASPAFSMPSILEDRASRLHRDAPTGFDSSAMLRERASEYVAPIKTSETTEVQNQAWFENNFKPLREDLNFSKVGRAAFADLSLIGQLKQTYILCQSDQHLVIIDQHAAHERIGFEKLRTSYAAGKIPVQTLLVPELLEVKEAEREVLLPHLEEFKKLGLEIEEFGANTFSIQAIPAILGNCDSKKLLSAMIEDLKRQGSSSKIEDHLHDLFATMACHRQVRAGDFLTPLEMKELILQLDEEAKTYHCPHGRPVMVQVDFREIEKWFKRVL
ncbi:MAG: DNA mismatch repair endonuclease MutL [Deltaproteobacteria bacterium]|nr:DNA mismatch repair endonuclease MutL [Deltaproteobacteria bacterium]